MHEYSITAEIVNSVMQEAANHTAKKVLEVHLVIGEFNFLGKEQLKFCYEILTKGSILEESKLYIEEQEGKVKCTACGYEGPLGHESDHEEHVHPSEFSCPKCGDKVEVISGRECLVKNIKLQV